MIDDFKIANLSEISKLDTHIKKVCAMSGDKDRIDSRKEIIALLDLTWTNKSKYASVIFSAGLKRNLSRKLIEETQERYSSGDISAPFWASNIKVYDHSDSINFAFALIYKYKYSGSLKMYDGIKEYSTKSFERSTITTMILKLSNYLAFKKEYYMVHSKLKSVGQSKLMMDYYNVYNN